PQHHGRVESITAESITRETSSTTTPPTATRLIRTSAYDVASYANLPYTGAQCAPQNLGLCLPQFRIISSCAGTLRTREIRSRLCFPPRHALCLSRPIEDCVPEESVLERRAGECDEARQGGGRSHISPLHK